MSRIKFVIILGATGTGKSRLAIQLAKKFNGEIIGADSMQVYEELDITSNKVTQQEREEVPHYLVDICKPTERFSVLDYRNLTLPIKYVGDREEKLIAMRDMTCKLKGAYGDVA